MRLVLVVALLASVPALAGCMQDPLPTGAAGRTELASMAGAWYEAPLAREPGHDHKDLSQHQNVSTSNFLLLGHDSLVTRDTGNRIVGSWGCGEVGETVEGRRLAILDGFGRDAHAIADITDPAHPYKVGEIVLRGASTWDDALTPDGRWAILGLNTILRQPTLGALAPVDGAPLTASFRDACTGEERAIPIPDIAFTSGVMAFDLADPANPVFADYFPTPAFNMHSVSTAIVDGRTYVTASTVQLVHTPSYFVFLEMLDTPLGGKLSYLSAFAPPPVAAPQGHVFVPSENGHNDVSIAKHPGNGKVYAYLAAWDGGMITLDLTVPEAPIFTANWAPPTTGLVSSALSDDCQAWGVHTTYPLGELWDDKHYVIVGQECPFHRNLNSPAGQVFIVDDTDPANPTMTGRWNLPVDTGIWTTEYQASPHYVAVEGRTLFVSMYHAGLWAVDLSGDLTAPPAIGMYMPSIPSGVGNPSFAAPVTEQVNVMSNGDIVLFENSSGVYVLRFDATSPAPAALPHFR